MLRDLADQRGEVPPEQSGTVMFQGSVSSNLLMIPTCKSRPDIRAGEDGKSSPSDPARLIIAVKPPCPHRGGWTRAEDGWAGWLRVPRKEDEGGEFGTLNPLFFKCFKALLPHSAGPAEEGLSLSPPPGFLPICPKKATGGSPRLVELGGRSKKVGVS